MTKEAGNGTKTITQKTLKPDKRDSDIMTTSKRNASTRSLLEENPEKRHRDVPINKSTMEKIETNA